MWVHYNLIPESLRVLEVWHAPHASGQLIYPLAQTLLQCLALLPLAALLFFLDRL